MELVRHTLNIHNELFPTQKLTVCYRYFLISKLNARYFSISKQNDLSNRSISNIQISKTINKNINK